MFVTPHPSFHCFKLHTVTSMAWPLNLMREPSLEGLQAKKIPVPEAIIHFFKKWLYISHFQFLKPSATGICFIATQLSSLNTFTKLWANDQHDQDERKVKGQLRCCRTVWWILTMGSLAWRSVLKRWMRRVCSGSADVTSGLAHSRKMVRAVTRVTSSASASLPTTERHNTHEHSAKQGFQSAPPLVWKTLDT